MLQRTEDTGGWLCVDLNVVGSAAVVVGSAVVPLIEVGAPKNALDGVETSKRRS